MRIIDRYNKTITSYDLNKGELVKGKLKNGSIVEDVLIYVIKEDRAQKDIPISTQIKKLKAQLAATDYKVIKCSECQLLDEPMPYDIVTLHTERQAIRDKINELEAQLCQS